MLISIKEMAKKYADYFYYTHEDLLKATIDVKQGQIIIKKEHSEELLKLICNNTTYFSAETFCFYLKQVFRRFNVHHGDNENVEKYDTLINAIIKRKK